MYEMSSSYVRPFKQTAIKAIKGDLDCIHLCLESIVKHESNNTNSKRVWRYAIMMWFDNNEYMLRHL